MEKVTFVFNGEETTAVFLDKKLANKGNLMCYAHLGQHGECSIEWFCEKREATISEALPLYKELTEKVGYELDVAPQDLFPYAQNLPDNAQSILDGIELDGATDYNELDRINNELKPLGYSFDYQLDGIPFNLKKL